MPPECALWSTELGCGGQRAIAIGFAAEVGHAAETLVGAAHLVPRPGVGDGSLLPNLAIAALRPTGGAVILCTPISSPWSTVVLWEGGVPLWSSGVLKLAPRPTGVTSSASSLLKVYSVLPAAAFIWMERLSWSPEGHTPGREIPSDRSPEGHTDASLPSSFQMADLARVSAAETTLETETFKKVFEQEDNSSGDATVAFSWISTSRWALA